MHILSKGNSLFKKKFKSTFFYPWGRNVGLRTKFVQSSMESFVKYIIKDCPEDSEKMG